MTPRELSLLARIEGKKDLARQKRARFETAIICTFLANQNRPKGKSAKLVKDIYKGMKIEDPEETKNVRVYKGSQKEQVRQHEEWLKSREHGSHS